MMKGLSVSVEMNVLDTAGIITRSLECTGDHCTSTVTSSLSTVSGSVILHVRVREVPSYSVPLGTLRVRVGVGTGGETHTQDGFHHYTVHSDLLHHLHLRVTVSCMEVVVTVFPPSAGVNSVPQHVYTPAWEVWSEENVRVRCDQIPSVSSLVSTMTILSIEVTGPDGPIQ